MAVIYYAKESARLDLTWALEEYRYRLADYSYAYKFNSLRGYNYVSMTTRILEGQEDPLAWRTEDSRCSILLRLKISPNEVPRFLAAQSAIPGYGICKNSNNSRCIRKVCTYSHICLKCQQKPPANTAVVHRITTDMRADLLWWQTFLDQWDGLKLLRHLDSRPTWHIWTDASGRHGMGGYMGEDLSQPALEALGQNRPSLRPLVRFP